MNVSAVIGGPRRPNIALTAELYVYHLFRVEDHHQICQLRRTPLIQQFWICLWLGIEGVQLETARGH